MNKKLEKKKRKREEKKKHLQGQNQLKKGFTAAEKKRGIFGIAIIVIMAAAAAGLGLYQLSQ